MQQQSTIHTQTLIQTQSHQYTPLLTSNFLFKQQGSKDHQVITKLYSKQITIEMTDQTQSNQDTKCKVQLDFDTIFSILKLYENQEEEKKYRGKPYGIKLEKYQDSVELHSQDCTQILKWEKLLSEKINQRNFHSIFKPIKKIGKGNFASVYLVMKYQDSQQYAAKAFSKQVQYAEERGKQALQNQINIMRSLNHKYLMKIQGVYQTQNSLYLCFEYLSGGLLYDKIKRRYNFSMDQMKTVMSSLLQGLTVMHQKNIMHRDLKPENIIFRSTDSFQCVIADFGLATYANLDNYIFTRCGTPGYVAPQISNLKQKNSKYGTICDIFSLGVIFHMLCLGKSPFPGKQCNEVLKQNRECMIDYQGQEYKKLSYTTLDLLKKMLEKDPEKRITAKQALKHQFFTEETQIIPEELLVKSKEEECQSPLMISKNPKRKRNLRLRDDSCLKFKMRQQIPLNQDQDIGDRINSPAHISKKIHRIRPDRKSKTFYPSNFKS